jgi:Asp-tRNA(Asn)/Glu-tRNA(Gln) amidotransferase A subunit family amidase
VPETAADQLMKVFAVIDGTETMAHAYRRVLVGPARAAASAVDSGHAGGALAGWPFAVKEVFDVAQVPVSGGSRAFSDRVPERDATVVRRLRKAGAVLVGTQISHELTCGADEPPTRNPWDLEAYPGGSSAGAGVSVALGSARFALGTDAAGSVRIPAAMTGTTGFKPTAGRVSAAGVFRQATAPSIDTVGIVARDAGELHRVLAVIEGPDTDDPRTLWAQFKPLTALAVAKQGGFTLAVPGPRTLAALNAIHPLQPCIETAFASVLETYRQAGVRVETVEIPEMAGAVGAVVTLFSAELATAHRDCLPRLRGSYFPQIADMLESSLDMDPDELARAVAIRTALRRTVDHALESLGAAGLITPTTPRVAMKLAGFDPAQELGTLIPFTCPFNLTGHPALSLPSGFSTDGLPIGHQIVGRIGDDQGVLEIGALFQTLTDWHSRMPSLSTSRRQ